MGILQMGEIEHMKQTIYSLIIMILLVIPSAFAQDSSDITTVILKQSTVADIKIPCINSTNSYCDTSVKCNITVIYPNSSILLRNVGMTNQVYYNNYTLSKTQTETAGIYTGSMLCKSSTQGAGFTSINLLINKDGVDLSGSMTSIILVGTVLIALLIFFITMAIIMESYLKLVFAGLSFVMLPIVLSVADSIIQDALMPVSIISIVSLGYILSLYMLGTFIFYAMYKLTMGLEIKDLKKEGAQTTETLLQGQGKYKLGRKEREKKDYEDDDDTFDEDK